MAENRRTVRDLRRGNRSTLLRTLYFQGPVSRQELGELTGLSAGSVSSVVAELFADGLAEDAGSVGSDGGRPRTLLRVAPGSGHLIGADIGETHVRVALFDLALTELARWEHPLRPGRPEAGAVVEHILTGVDLVLAKGDVAADAVIGVGVGVPGIVERDPEAVVHGQTFGWDAVPLERLLRAGTPLPLFIDNGATAQGQAEMWFGAGRDADTAVIALIGSGVGASIVTGGSPYRGATSSAGEWGHTVVQVGGRTCRCGAVGCLEAYIGARAVLDRYRTRRGGGIAPGGGSLDGCEPAGSGPVSAAGQQEAFAALLRAAADGADPRAREVVEEAAAYLGAGIADLVNLFNPERIILGGWAGLLLARHALPVVREATARYALRRPLARTEITAAALGPDAVALGAATLPLARFLGTGGRT
ncbi:ROK family protein [Streptomyces sp. NEAU-Y11]|uniref:ROK family protein n=1 Tax=Streptomyces cucumeris TaxID=2962890 RepID=UPI0020C93682|nr:ROK family protein [Streptomyces sp. NEAU-Y11]MCP9207944.1 ROK family protein [Streptomyces sp. NEAU-Y11]